MGTLPKSFSRTKALINVFDRKGQRASEGYLRLEANLQASGTYTFQVNANANQLITETRLRSGDAFIPTKVGMFLRTVATATDANQTTSVLQTYPNTTVFTSSTAVANLEALYNSRLQITINSVNLTEFIDTIRFRRITAAQQGLAVSTQATTGLLSKSAWENENYGMSNFEQDCCFNGQANNTCQVILPTAVDCGAGATVQNYLVILFRGVLVQDGAKFVNDKSLRTFSAS
jgi:hypothetical protein